MNIPYIHLSGLIVEIKTETSNSVHDAESSNMSVSTKYRNKYIT